MRAELRPFLQGAWGSAFQTDSCPQLAREPATGVDTCVLQPGGGTSHPWRCIHFCLILKSPLKGSGGFTTLARNTLSTTGLSFSPLENGNNISLTASYAQKQSVSHLNPGPGIDT